MELFLKTPVYRNAKRIESFSKVYVPELCVCIYVCLSTRARSWLNNCIRAKNSLLLYPFRGGEVDPLHSTSFTTTVRKPVDIF